MTIYKPQVKIKPRRCNYVVKKTVKTTKILKTTDRFNWDLMSDIGSNQLTSVHSKIIRKPINPSRKEVTAFWS